MPAIQGRVTFIIGELNLNVFEQSLSRSVCKIYTCSFAFQTLILFLDTWHLTTRAAISSDL